MKRLRFVVLAAVSLFVFGLAGAPAGAQVESKCLSSQLKASGAYAAAREKCESKAAAKGEAVDPTCLAKALEKATKALANAEKKDDCIETGRTERVDEAVEDFVADIQKILNPPPLLCCQLTNACLYLEDGATCTGTPYNGTLGAEGSVCNGNGTCAAPPATAGNCCEDISVSGVTIDCLNGDATFDVTDCNGIGGEFSTGICTRSGFCE